MVGGGFRGGVIGGGFRTAGIGGWRSGWGGRPGRGRWRGGGWPIAAVSALAPWATVIPITDMTLISVGSGTAIAG
jgi:hypothetical protein